MTTEEDRDEYRKQQSEVFAMTVGSTVWTESKEVKILWIVLLACVDEDGHVDLGVQDMARRARLTEVEVAGALRILIKGNWVIEDGDGYRVVEW